MKPAAKAAPAKRKRESSSSSSSDSDDDVPVKKSNGTTVDETLKKQKTETGAVVTANGGASNTIFVGGLSFDAEEADVKAFFEEFGEIKTVRIPVHMDTGRRKGMAFVEFSSVRNRIAYTPGMASLKICRLSLTLHSLPFLFSCSPPLPPPLWPRTRPR